MHIFAHNIYILHISPIHKQSSETTLNNIFYQIIK